MFSIASRKVQLTALLGLLLLCGCSGAPENTVPHAAKYEEFTTCGLAIENKSKCNALAVPGVSCLNISAAYLDTKRGCYGTRWRVPAAYFIGRESTLGHSAERVNLSVNVPELTAGPGSSSDIYTKIVIIQMIYDWVDDPQLVVDFDAAPGVKRTGEMVRGMQVFTKNVDFSFYILLIPAKSPKYFLFCSPDKGKGYSSASQFLSAKDELAGCKIEQHIGPGLYAKYYVNHDQLNDIEHIVGRMQALFDSFIVKQSKN